jgi:hypothetical protein
VGFNNGNSSKSFAKLYFLAKSQQAMMQWLAIILSFKMEANPEFLAF